MSEPIKVSEQYYCGKSIYRNITVQRVENPTFPFRIIYDVYTSYTSWWGKTSEIYRESKIIRGHKNGAPWVLEETGEEIYQRWVHEAHLFSWFQILKQYILIPERIERHKEALSQDK